MEQTLWSGLLANLAVLVLILSAWTHLQDRFEARHRAVKPLAFGLLMGGAAVAVMLFPVQLRTGVFFDLRTTPIALSGFFFGPLAGLATLVVAGCYRLLVGGAGAMAGLFGMILTTAVSLAGYYLVRSRPSRSLDIVLLAMAAPVATVGGFLALPAPLLSTVLTNTAPATSVLIFASVLVSGLALVRDQKRRQAVSENLGYRRIMETIPDSLNVKDTDGRFIAANPATAVLMRAGSPEALIGKTDFDFYSHEEAARFRAEELDVIAKGVPVSVEHQLNDGVRPTYLATLKIPMRDATGKIIGLITHNRDVTEQRRLEREMHESQRRLSYALAQMSDGLAMFDRDGRLVFCNEQYRAFFPRTGSIRVPGAQIRDILRAAVTSGEQLGRPQDLTEEWIDEIAAALYVTGEEEVHLFDGRWLHIRTRPSADGSSMVVVSDATRIKETEAALRESTKQLELLATTDGLTGLANRRTFDQSLDREVARSMRESSPLSVLLMDIDRFKAFNDIYGHPAGDACLKVVSRCFRQVLKRPTDVAARYGGEEFAAILPGTDEDGAFFIAEEFRATLAAQRLEHSGSEKGIVTASVGIAAWQMGDELVGPGEFVSRADQALYVAKGAGRDRVYGFHRREGKLGRLSA